MGFYTSQLRLKNSKFCSVYLRYKTPCAFKKYPPAVPGRSRGSSALGNAQAVSLYGPMRSSPGIKSSQSESRVCAHVWKSACLCGLFVSQHKQGTITFLKLKRTWNYTRQQLWVNYGKWMVLMNPAVFVLHINNWFLLYMSEVWTCCSSCARDAVQNRRLRRDANHRMWILWEMPESQEEIRWKGQYI